MWGDEFDKAMNAAGVSTNDRATKAYERVKQAVKEHSEIFIGADLGEALREASRLSSVLKEQTTNAKTQYIDDREIRNAVAAFNATLNIVQSIFGEENMTEIVMCKAIEAGSYIAYRSIMGETAQPAKRY